MTTHAINHHHAGPEEQRWTRIREQRTENLGADGGGTIETNIDWTGRAVQLNTHPGDDCCPIRTLTGDDRTALGHTLYSVMLGEAAATPLPLHGDADVAGWWASVPHTPVLARKAACKRLLAKMRIDPVAGGMSVEASARLLVEGLRGVREMACNKK